MLFNSYIFLIFLPIMLLLYSVSKRRTRQVFLLIGSYFFYCYAYPPYGLLLLFSTVLDFIVGWQLGKSVEVWKRRILLAISLVGNLGVLAFFKYADFLGSSFSNVLTFCGTPVEWSPLGYILPIGISFYTFQTMSYTIEIYWRRLEPTSDLLSFALYVSYFPQLVAGPIERAPNLLPQLQEAPSATALQMVEGLERIIWGMLKKVVIADRLAFLVNQVYNNPLDDVSSATLWLATYAFAFQIYFDFSGYSDIAIGTAQLFGVKLMENFNHPYMSTNISEFWRRWHISFSTWLRDYLFIPLGGSRKGLVRTLTNVTIVMFLGGLWHGAAWNFVVWGLYQGFLLVIYHGWQSLWASRRHKALPGNGTLVQRIMKRVLNALAILFTFHVACIGWVFFRAPLSKAIDMLHRMLLDWRWQDVKPIPGAGVFLSFLALLYISQIIQEFLPLRPKIAAAHPLLRGTIYAILVVIIIFGGVSTTQQFIYFQF